MDTKQKKRNELCSTCRWNMIKCTSFLCAAHFCVLSNPEYTVWFPGSIQYFEWQLSVQSSSQLSHSAARWAQGSTVRPQWHLLLPTHLDARRALQLDVKENRKPTQQLSVQWASNMPSHTTLSSTVILTKLLNTPGPWHRKKKVHMCRKPAVSHRKYFLSSSHPNHWLL